MFSQMKCKITKAYDISKSARIVGEKAREKLSPRLHKHSVQTLKSHTNTRRLSVLSYSDSPQRSRCEGNTSPSFSAAALLSLFKLCKVLGPTPGGPCQSPPEHCSLFQSFQDDQSGSAMVKALSFRYGPHQPQLCNSACVFWAYP